MAFLPKVRILTILMCALALLVALIPGPVTAQAEIVAVVTADQLNMRTAPSTRAPLLTTLARGQTIKVTGRDRNVGWGYGTAENGALGWFVLNFVEVQSGNVRNLPILDATAPTNPPDGASAPAAQPQGSEQSAAPTEAPPPPPPPASGRISGGFELGGQVAGLGPITVAAMRRAGMTWVKRQAFAGDGAANAFIAEAKANGFKILLSVIGDKELVVTDSYHDVYASYVAGLAAAGADAIEVWNEQNLDREWKKGAISPQIYTRLLAKAYNAIKAANPGTIVISGAPAPTGAAGPGGKTDAYWNDDVYVREMAAAGAGRYADCIGLHYNEGIVSPRQRSGDPRGDNYPTRYFDGQIARGLNPFGGKRGCFTELGYLSPEGYGPLPGGFIWAANTSVAEQAAWLAEAAVRASSSGRIRLMIIFNVDFTFYGEDPQGGFAIIRPDGSCPACETLARAFGR